MFSAVVLAAGKGTRMRSPLPKVLHRLANLTLVEGVLQSLKSLSPLQIIVVGSGELFSHAEWQRIREQHRSSGSSLQEVVQEEALGTGHAAQMAFPFLNPRAEKVLICHGDMPLIQPASFQAMVEDPEADFVVGATVLSHPTTSSFGRLEVKGREVSAILEVKEAMPEQRQNPLGNAAVYAIKKSCLDACLFQLRNDNAAKEYYLTDMVREARRQGFNVTYQEIPEDEAYGINTQEDLLKAPAQRVLRRKMLQHGVMLQDAETVMLSMDTCIGEGTFVAPFTVFEAGVTLGKRVTVHPFCVLSECCVGDDSSVGPFAHIKQGSSLAENVTLGNFVEVKKSKIGPKTKAKHLTYLGDATVGARVNIGAGTVVCNYDGFKKHPTTIEDEASVGANTSLIAPVTVGAASCVGAGSVITKDVLPGSLSLSRAQQIIKADWERKRREKNAKLRGPVT